MGAGRVSMDKFIVIDDPNDKFTVIDDPNDRFAEHQRTQYKFAVEDGQEQEISESTSPRYKYSVAADSNRNTFAESLDPHHKFTVEDAPAASEGKKPRWPLWKILTVAGVVLLVVIALAVGLGVGLSQKKKGTDDAASGQQDGDTQGSGDGTSGSDGNSNGDSNGSGSSGGSNDSDDSDSSGDSSSSDTPKDPSSWQPEVDDTFQIVLSGAIEISDKGKITPDVDIFELDLFDNSQEVIGKLQDAGKGVLCYFSSGTWEEWRDDKDYFDKNDLGNELEGYPDEKYVNISSSGVRNIMAGRISLAKKKGCDGVDAGYVDTYLSKTGLNLTQKDTINYVKFLSDEARSHGLAVGFKNGGSMTKEVLDWVDYSMLEECVRWSECSSYRHFIDAGKPVFNVEYPDGAPDDVNKSVRENLCSNDDNESAIKNYSMVLKTEDLDGWAMYCDGKEYTTSVESSER